MSAEPFAYEYKCGVDFVAGDNVNEWEWKVEDGSGQWAKPGMFDPLSVYARHSRFRRRLPSADTPQDQQSSPRMENRLAQPSAGSGWVKGREPDSGDKDEDGCVWLLLKPSREVRKLMGSQVTIHDTWHPKPLIEPPAPPQEPTREERDEEAAREFTHSMHPVHGSWDSGDVHNAFLAGVRYGRETK